MGYSIQEKEQAFIRDLGRMCENWNSPADSENHIKQIDKNIHSPSFAHFVILQSYWIKDHEYYLKNRGCLGLHEVDEDYRAQVSDKFHLFYFDKYIASAFCNLDSYRSLNPEDFDFIDLEFDRIYDLKERKNITSDKYNVDCILAEVGV